MMAKLKYALIGCGRIAPNHMAAAVANSDELEIAAICDIIPENRGHMLELIPAALRKNVKLYEDYRIMLEEIHPDLAAIATESGNHAAIALDCIAAGCHLIVEKPIALSIADAKGMISAAKNKGVVFCACHQNRFNPSIRKIREAVDSGRFGRLLHGAAHVRWRRDRDYYTQAPWRGTWAQDGGALMNQCIHNIDLLRWMMGDEITEVAAVTDRLTHGYIEGEDLGLAIVKFANGSYGLIEGTTNVFPHNLEETLYIFGEKGTVKAGGKSVNIIEEWAFADGADDPEHVRREFSDNPPNVYGFGHTPLYADVVSAIREGREPLVDGEAGLRALELVLAIYKSSKTGLPVKLPLDDFSTLDMAGFFDGDER